MSEEMSDHVDYYSHDEVRLILANLSSREKKVIALSARILSTHIQGIEHEDLIHDVFISILKVDKPRRWPRNVISTTFFSKAMRSLADNNKKKSFNNHDIVTESETPELNQLTCLENMGVNDYKDRQLDAENKIKQLQDHFSGDQHTQIIMMGRMEGYSEEEIKSQFQLTQKAYDSARKRLSRTLIKMDYEEADHE